MSFIKAVASIAAAAIVGAVAAVPGSFAGLIIAQVCLPGPTSGEIVMALPFLAGFIGAIVGLPCGAIGWFTCFNARLRGPSSLLLSVSFGLVAAAFGSAAFYWLLIAPNATVNEHSIMIAGIGLTIGVGGSGGISAWIGRAITLAWK